MDVIPGPWRQKVQMAPQAAVFFEKCKRQSAPAFQIGIVASESFYLFSQGDPVMEQQSLVRQNSVPGMGKFQIGAEKPSGGPADPESPPAVAQKESRRQQNDADD